METHLILAVVAGILVVILFFMLRSARRKLELYGFLVYDNSPQDVFKAINRLPSTPGKDINFDEDVIKMYFLRYFKKIADAADNQTYNMYPIVRIGEIFSSLSTLISQKEKVIIKQILTSAFVETVSEKMLADIYFLYLRDRLSDPGRNSSPREETGEEIIFEHLLAGGAGNSNVDAFLWRLEELIKSFRQSDVYSSTSKVFIEGHLIRVRAKLGDSRTTKLEI